MVYQEGYWLTREAMKWFWNNYAPNNSIRKEPTTISLLHASIDQLRGLPLALVITDEFDALRGEGETYMLIRQCRQVFRSQQLGILVL
ncbi:MAG: alpha/beta hydrolase [Thermoproteota archaeon]|nr:alpha/beta hydrolase [Thermoproteota archaeon]